MKAAKSFAAALEEMAFSRGQCDLLGSLAWSGEGHATAKAVTLGLAGFAPDRTEPDRIDALIDQIRADRRLRIAGRDIAFDPGEDVRFNRIGETPVHPNTLCFVVYDGEGRELLVQRWCSMGGGFIAPEDCGCDPALKDERDLPFRSGRPLSCCHFDLIHIHQRRPSA